MCKLAIEIDDSFNPNAHVYSIILVTNYTNLLFVSHKVTSLPNFGICSSLAQDAAAQYMDSAAFWKATLSSWLFLRTQ